jgi:hypothetical protein
MDPWSMEQQMNGTRKAPQQINSKYSSGTESNKKESQVFAFRCVRHATKQGNESMPSH